LVFEGFANSFCPVDYEGRPLKVQTSFWNISAHKNTASRLAKNSLHDSPFLSGEAEREMISDIINNLLDNITSTNRQYVDKRLDELKRQRQQLEDRLQELGRFSLSHVEIDNIVTEAMKLVGGLDFTLHQGLPQEKLVVLRQCIEKIWINKPTGEIKLAIRQVPAGNLQDTIEIKTSLETVLDNRLAVALAEKINRQAHKNLALNEKDLQVSAERKKIVIM
jgi:hypothetical protein